MAYYWKHMAPQLSGFVRLFSRTKDRKTDVSNRLVILSYQLKLGSWEPGWDQQRSESGPAP